MSEFKDKVLFLGDSICRHYFPFSSEFLEQNSELEGVLPDKWTSCQWKQVRYAKSVFVEKRKYNGRKLKARTVHFNFGLHSIKLPNKGQDPDITHAKEEEFEIYEKELIESIEVFRDFERNVIFSNTTPSPKNHRVRNDEDVVRLNEIAKKVMDEHNVPYNDLYSFVKSQENYPLLYLHPRAENNCHFNDVGRAVLGEQIGKFVMDNFFNELH